MFLLAALMWAGGGTVAMPLLPQGESSLSHANISVISQTDPAMEGSTAGTPSEAQPAEESSAIPERDKLVKKRTVPDSVIQRLQASGVYAYANDSAYWKSPEPRRDWLYFAGRNSWIKRVLYMLLGAFFLFALYRIIVANKLYLFYSSGTRRRSNALKPEQEQEENLEERITDSIRMSDYRTAIRLMYLKALGLMDEKGWIQLNPGNTNRDYLEAVKQRPAADTFRLITRIYEYVWYGEFKLNKQGFEALHTRFEQFYKALQ
jgi:hypothetical protein